jgi:5-methylcytosine-specific restriction endonuclease McrA
MARAPKLCAWSTCGEIVPAGHTYCPEHKRERDRQAWATATPTASARAARDDPNWQHLRRIVFERDGNVCQLRYPGVCTHRASTVDHVIEASDGGSNDPSNLVAACRPCNQLKAARHARARQLRDRPKPSSPIGYWDDGGFHPA